MIAILEFGRRGTGDEKVDHRNRLAFAFSLTFKLADPRFQFAYFLRLLLNSI